ncbi:unnamed protein product [Haemonchus placei]|uniref:Uncharacterized protein n=1 Tax=Haemonchus placei TaxID=6290 RepID=A0A158QKX2_HAEPC|nr:unnamed protein product [Haemonchus placei]
MDVFKQRYMLRLRAISWISVCYDLPYAYHVIRDAMNTTRIPSEETEDIPIINAPVLATPSPSTSSLICSAFHVSHRHRCPVSSSQQNSVLAVAVLTQPTPGGICKSTTEPDTHEEDLHEQDEPLLWFFSSASPPSSSTNNAQDTDQEKKGNYFIGTSAQRLCLLTSQLDLLPVCHLPEAFGMEIFRASHVELFVLCAVTGQVGTD